MIFNEKYFLNGLKDQFLQKTVCSLCAFLHLQYFKYTSGLDEKESSHGIYDASSV